MGKCPGIMLYFDIRPSLRRLTYNECGMLFEAILDYGESGLLPEFDGMLGVAWDFIQPRIDKDKKHYDEIALQRKYANYVKQTKSAGTDKLDFEAWKDIFGSDSLRPKPPETGWNPTTTSTTTSSSSSTTTATTGPFRPKTTEQEFEDMRRTQIDRFLAATADMDDPLRSTHSHASP